MGIPEMGAHGAPSHLLAGLLLCVSLVFLPVDTMSPEDASTEHAVLERTEAPAFVEVGEGNHDPPPKQDDDRQEALQAIERILHETVIDPKQAMRYKAAAETVKRVEENVKEDLMGVVQMKMLLARVNEAQAKKASGEDIDMDSWAHEAGASVDEVEEEEAAAAPGTCFDTHSGLCGGIQSQGHCGIKEYAESCRLSCRICAMPASFRLGLDEHEKVQKVAEEKSAKAAKSAVQEKFEKK